MNMNRAGFLWRLWAIGIASRKLLVFRLSTLVKILPWVVVGSCLVWTNPSSAFYDDLCFAQQRTESVWTVANCLANSKANESITGDWVSESCVADSASEKDSKCNTAVQTSFSNGSNDSAYHPRSMIHADSVYLLAQAVGLDARAAYFIAAYGDTPDRAGGQFILMVSASGGSYTKYTDPLHATIALPDLVRGYPFGAAIHFPLFTKDTANIVPDSPDEGVSRLRSWALGDGSGNFPNPCLGGLTSLTSPYFQGNRCYVSSSAFSFESGAYSVNQSTNVSNDPSFQSGDQPFSCPSANSSCPQKISSATDSTMFAGDLQNLLNASPARWDGANPVPLALLNMGVYLHSLMDRVSHAPGQNPLKVLPVNDLPFESKVDFPKKTARCVKQRNGRDLCVPTHPYLHFEEVGIPKLSPRTEEALNLTYDELAVFAQQNPQFMSQFMAQPPRITAKSKVVSALVNSVLNQRSAAARLSQLETLSQKLGYYSLTQPPPACPADAPWSAYSGTCECGADLSYDPATGQCKMVGRPGCGQTSAGNTCK